MRMSDWSSDVFSSDLEAVRRKTVPLDRRVSAIHSLAHGLHKTNLFGGILRAILCQFDKLWPNALESSRPTLACINISSISERMTATRSEERCVGKECDSTLISW